MRSCNGNCSPRNPKPCPLMDMTSAGERCTRLALDGDIATDLPKYRVYKNDAFIEKSDIVEEWKDDFAVLAKKGIPIRHKEEKKLVPMFKTSISTVAVGPFHGPLVVSMRPIPKELVDEACKVSKDYPKAHGEPIHVGDPKEIGIVDITKPDYGEAVTIYPKEAPVFWACGVTSQVAVGNAGPSEWMSHSPGCMLVTDIPI